MFSNNANLVLRLYNGHGRYELYVERFFIWWKIKEGRLISHRWDNYFWVLSGKHFYRHKVAILHIVAKNLLYADSKIKIIEI